MKKLKEQLKTLSKDLVVLSRQTDKLTKQVAKLEASAARKPAAKKKAPKTGKKKSAKKGASKKPSVLDSVYSTIKRSGNGIDIPTLKGKTRLGSKQLSNALFKLTQKGVIRAKERGIYQTR